MNKSFISFFGNDVFGKTQNFYGVAKKSSKTSFKKYKNFLKKSKLPFKIIKNHDFSEKIDGPIISKEKNLNYFKIKKKIRKILRKKKIKVKLNQTLSKKDLLKYDKVIIACYDQNNNVLNTFGKKPEKKYKFELVEKIIIKLPLKFKNKSYMVLDGKFVSLDPYIGTKYHLLSDVKYSKIEIIKGYYPIFKDYRKKFLNKGIIRVNKITNFKKFIRNSSKFLPFLKEAKYVGSFYVTRAIEANYVTRAIEANKGKTDERSNSVKFIDNKIITVFSGKWNTAIGLAKFLLKNKKVFR